MLHPSKEQWVFLKKQITSNEEVVMKCMSQLIHVFKYLYQREKDTRNE